MKKIYKFINYNFFYIRLSFLVALTLYPNYYEIRHFFPDSNVHLKYVNECQLVVGSVYIHSYISSQSFHDQYILKLSINTLHEVYKNLPNCNL